MNNILYCKINSAVHNVRVVEKSRSLEGFSCPDIVEIYIGDKKFKGYQKKDNNEFNHNDMEQLLCCLGEIINIPLALNIRLYTDSQCTIPYSSVSISVESNENEKFISFKDMRDELYNDVIAGDLPSNKWIEEWSLLRQRIKADPTNKWEVEAISDSDYINCIKFPFEVAELWKKKHSVLLKSFDTSVIRMSLFDILIGQADRTPSNYGILVNKIQNTAKLSPLFDNSTITKPYMKDDMNNFNQVLLHRYKFFLHLKKHFGQQFCEVAKCIASKKNELLATIDDFSNRLSINDYRLIKRRVIEGCALFESIEELY